ncbi:MAG: energy transducer TonB, partial [Myxococcota bacterium]|nr:energy transducer TonB [Myxococcota bacterium]
DEAGGGANGGPSAEEIRRARRAYADRVRELLGRAARYPTPARRGGIEGRVVIGLRIAEDGRLLAARVTGSCGYSMLDEAALAAANDLSRVPAPPSLVAWRSADELRVPIVFELTR